MELRLSFTLLPEEKREPAFGTTNQPSTGQGLAELFRDDVDVPISLALGSMGKGASMPAVEVIFHVTEEVLNDGATLFAWGTVLRAAWKRVTDRQARRLSNQDTTTISAMASAADPSNADRLLGAQLIETICPTGGSAEFGTDERDVWIDIYLLANEDLYLIFSSPTGLVLGSVVIPPEWSEARGRLTSAEAVTVFRQLNQIG